jgi:hypothetical protein
VADCCERDNEISGFLKSVDFLDCCANFSNIRIMVLTFSVVNKRNFVLHEIFVHVIKLALTRLFSVWGMLCLLALYVCFLLLWQLIRLLSSGKSIITSLLELCALANMQCCSQ